MKVKDAMHKGVDWVSPDTPITEIAKLMRAHDIGCIPIGEDDKLVGMVTDRDIVCKGLAGNGFDASRAKARDVMTEGIHCCREDDDLAKAVHHMETLKVRRLPVINKSKRMVGIISLGDVSHSVRRFDGRVRQNVAVSCAAACCDRIVRNGSHLSDRERVRGVLLESLDRASAERAASIVRAEVAAPGLRRQTRELRSLHADQRGVIAAFHIDVPPRIDAVVDDDVQPVAFAERRDGPAVAVLEQPFDFVLARQVDLVAELTFQGRQMQVTGGRKNGHDVPSRRSTTALASASPGTWQASAVRVDDIVGA